MRNDKNRRPHLVDLLKEKHQFKAADRVQVTGRLVGYNHARVIYEGAGNGNTLLFTA